MKIKIQTASKEAEIAVLGMFRTSGNQIVALTYSSGMYVLLEQLLQNAFSPLFPIDSPLELDKLFKTKSGEKTVFLNIEIERISEIESEKLINDEIYHIYYKKNEKFYNLIENENSHIIFGGNANNTMMFLMNEINIEEDLRLDGVLERIQQVGVKNITKIERNFLQRISNQ